MFSNHVHLLLMNSHNVCYDRHHKPKETSMCRLRTKILRNFSFYIMIFSFASAMEHDERGGAPSDAPRSHIVQRTRPSDVQQGSLADRDQLIRQLLDGFGIDSCSAHHLCGQAGTDELLCILLRVLGYALQEDTKTAIPLDFLVRLGRAVVYSGDVRNKNILGRYFATLIALPEACDTTVLLELLQEAVRLGLKRYFFSKEKLQ